MTSPDFSRRDFVKTATLAAAALPLASARLGAATAAAGDHAKSVPLHWIDGVAPAAFVGATWGVPWPRGQHTKETPFALRAADGTAVPVQSWPLATWPDGSLKWTAHAMPGDAPLAKEFTLAAGETPAAPKHGVTVSDSADAFTVNTGVLQATLGRGGSSLLRTLSRDGRETLRDGRLVCLVQDRAEPGADGTVRVENFSGEISAVTIEQRGPIRAVVKFEGKHRSTAGRAWLPFVVRLYFHAGSDAVRVVHTIVYDGDEQKDFIRGLGVRFTAPLAGELHDRHIRFTGEDGGLFGEAVRGVTGLRRDPGPAVTSAQIAGAATPPLGAWPAATSRRMNFIPAYADWTLFQPNSDSFEIRKRTAAGQCWLRPESGRRASGVGYLGSPQGGVAFGLRNFWESFPAQFDIRGATGDAAEVTLWLWAPEAAPMDLRFYHDGMGETNYAAQNEGLEITYEDYEPGWERPQGVARTSELFLWALPATPAREKFAELAAAGRAPATLACAPAHLLRCGVFGAGELWSLPGRGSPAKAKLEDQLDFHFAHYVKQREQHRWYGFWNFGDVMHSYDRDRHVWKYDIGGFAWDNSELSTEIWLWLHYLRSGRGDVFRFAEAMTRHTGEVDVHHLGRFAPLGSRHNVLHWGCSAKQPRISTAANRRYLYFLSGGDERIGDLLREQLGAARALVAIEAGRKRGGRGEMAKELPDTAKAADATHTRMGFGNDWGAVAAAWLTEWERTGDTATRDRLLNSMRTIAAQPHGFFSGGSRMNLATGEFDILPAGGDRVGASHLNTVFGETEVCAELLELVDMPEFAKAWLDYCDLYNAGGEEQQRRLGRSLGSLNLKQGHARLTALAAKKLRRPDLAHRAWEDFFGGSGGMPRQEKLESVSLRGPAVLNARDEVAWISTNSVAQWGLAAMGCLALAGEALIEPKGAPAAKGGEAAP